ncbi:MAG: zinc-binding dehydrogenase [Clostridiaceae bacterium]|nr:zinc-binding dehydrogenase [Clostridiaceae bacterium]
MLVKVGGCGLCNWELNHWKGLIGPNPQPLGHEWAGEVVQLGEDVEGFEIGDLVSGESVGMTGFSEYLIANAKGCFKLDKSVDTQTALVEPLQCVVTVLNAAAPEAGDYGIIQGCGPMGLWCVQALSGNFQSGLIAVDIDDYKLELAQKYGATHTINSSKTDVKERIAEITKGHMADFVIEGTGIPALLNNAVPYLRRNGRGRLVLMSSHEEPCKEFDFREAIERSIEIRVAHPAYQLKPQDNLRRAIEFINRGVFKMDEIITHKFTLDEIQKAFETLENRPSDFIKGVVVP